MVALEDTHHLKIEEAESDISNNDLFLRFLENSNLQDNTKSIHSLTKAQTNKIMAVLKLLKSCSNEIGRNSNIIPPWFLSKGSALADADSIMENLIKIKTTTNKIIIDKYKNNQEIKQQIIKALLEEGTDICNINQSMIQGLVLEIPEIKKESIEQSIDAVLNQFAQLDLTPKDKKIFVFELAQVSTFFDCAFKIDEHIAMLIHYIAEKLSMPQNDADQLIEAPYRISVAKAEAMKLVTQ